MTSQEIAARAQEIYDSRLRAQVESAHKGQYIVIDVESGDYEIADDFLLPTRLLHSRHPDALLHTIRIGYPVAGRIGGRVAPVAR
jgi:hypothetical protein